MKTLREAKVGDTVKVVKLHGEGATKRPLQKTFLFHSIKSCSVFRLPTRNFSDLPVFRSALPENADEVRMNFPYFLPLQYCLLC